MSGMPIVARVSCVAWKYRCSVSTSTPSLSQKIARVGAAILMKAPRLHQPAFDARQRMKHDERMRIVFADDGLDLAELEARDHAIDNVLFGALETAVAPIHRDPAAEIASDRFADRGAFVRHDGDRREFVDAVDHEVERPGR